METILTTQNIVSIIAILALVVDKFFSGKKRDKQGDIQTESAAMDLLRNTVETYKSEVEKLRTDQQLQGKQIATMEGVIAEKDKQLAMFERVFQNRNPEMEEFMKFMTQATKDQSETHKLIVKVLTDIQKMSMDNSVLLQKEAQDLHIEATISKQ